MARNSTKTSPRPRVNKEAKILSTACQLFAQNGFDGTSIRDISGAVGISNAALYHYFSDKDALFTRIFISVTENLCCFVESHIEPNKPASTQLRAFMGAYGVYFEDHRSECVAASLSFRVLKQSEQRNQAMYWRDRYEGVLRKIIQDGVDNGEFQEVSAALTGRAVLSCLNWLQRWYSPDGDMRPVEIVDAYADIILGGINKN